MGRFLSPKDIAAAKFEEEVFYSRLKREAIKYHELIIETRHVVCGCGAEGCIFLSHSRKEPDEKLVMKQLKKRVGSPTLKIDFTKIIIENSND